VFGEFFRTPEQPGSRQKVEVLIGTSGRSQLLKADFEETMPNLQMVFAGAPGPEVLKPPSQMSGRPLN
jgi:hypothetical protein